MQNRSLQDPFYKNRNYAQMKRVQLYSSVPVASEKETEFKNRIYDLIGKAESDLPLKKLDKVRIIEAFQDHGVLSILENNTQDCIHLYNLVAQYGMGIRALAELIEKNGLNTVRTKYFDLMDQIDLSELKDFSAYFKKCFKQSVQETEGQKHKVMVSNDFYDICHDYKLANKTNPDRDELIILALLRLAESSKKHLEDKEWLKGMMNKIKLSIPPSKFYDLIQQWQRLPKLKSQGQLGSKENIEILKELIK